MKNMKMYFFFTEKWCEKGKISFFHVIFLNNDISFTILDIVLNFLMSVFDAHPERILSQIFYLGPSFLCDIQNNVLKISKKIFVIK